MINLPDDSDASTELNMTPMIDCVFLLLIFFLVAATLKKVERQVPLALPDANSAITKPAEKRSIVISIDAKGQTFIENAPVSRDALVARVRDASTKQPNAPIRIDADRLTAYENVLHVIDALQLAGFKEVGLKTLDTARAPSR